MKQKTETHMSVGNLNNDLFAQREYAKKLKDSGFQYSLVVAGAFIRGMRDIGYKSNATAINELIDNAIQASAKNVHVVLGYEKDNKSEKKPDYIAVVDDGHGMDPEMVRASVLWGGTHRENDRSGFGRFGYGLPSASVSIGRRFTVYSKVDGGEVNAVTIDLDEIGTGKYTNKQGQVIVPEAVKRDLPAWVSQYIDQKFNSYEHGTVVLLEKADRLEYQLTDRLRAYFLQQFGITYRTWLGKINLWVDGQRVVATDPLFLTEGCRFFDEDEDRAEALEPLTVAVKDANTKEELGRIKVRFSYMPPTFLRKPEYKLQDERGKGRTNSRFEVRKDNNGIIVLRHGRQIDVVTTRCPWAPFQNNDRYVGVEIDFPPSLDSEFSVTTSKQQIIISDRIWDVLEQNGVGKALSQMRRRYLKEAKAIQTQHEETDGKRPSERVMEESQGHFAQSGVPPTGERIKKAIENLEQETKQRSKESGVGVEDIKRTLEFEAKQRPWKVVEVDYPGAPFFRPVQVGAQFRIELNRSHAFYTEMYAGPQSNPYIRASLELLLFVIGMSELEKGEEAQAFYCQERNEWSNKLGLTLVKLAGDMGNYIFDSKQDEPVDQGVSA